MTFDFKTFLAEKQKRINDTLLEMLQRNDENPNRLTAAMQYSLMAGGKRLRPILCLSAAEAVGGNPDDAMSTACALEMIHTYSLIHDDLPAMDDDRLRRGKPTCHVAFDEATAILAGDALLTLAFQTLSPDFDSGPQDGPLVLKWLKVIHLIAHAAGHTGMIDGQMRDMLSEGKRLRIEELKALHFRKTGAIIKAAVCAGVLLGNGNMDQMQHLGGYAKRIGLAFQVRDDILNVEGDPEIMGKAAGTDTSRNKNTFPALIGIEESKAFARKLVNESLQVLEHFDNKADPLRAIATYIIEREK